MGSLRTRRRDGKWQTNRWTLLSASISSSLTCTKILDVLEILGMIDSRVSLINTVDDVPVAKPIVQMVIQAKQALQGTLRAVYWRVTRSSLR